jgi:hypothetical protein
MIFINHYGYFEGLLNIKCEYIWTPSLLVTYMYIVTCHTLISKMSGLLALITMCSLLGFGAFVVGMIPLSFVPGSTSVALQVIDFP